jgi:hypothetical protein
VNISQLKLRSEQFNNNDDDDNNDNNNNNNNNFKNNTIQTAKEIIYQINYLC